MSTEISVPGTAVASPEWRRLSRRMLLVHPVRELGRALPGLVVLLLAGSGSGHGALWGLLGAVIVTVLSVSRWFTTRYRVSADQVQIREGLFRRRTLAARLDRVRTVDVTSHALHRALGLARVEIGTGVSDRKGKSVLKLDGLPADQAARLRGELLHRSSAEAGTTTLGALTRDAAPSASAAQDAGVSRADLVPGTLAGARPEFAPEEVEIAHLEPDWIRFAPFTLSGVFTGLAVAGFAWRIVSESNVNVERIGVLHSATQQLDNAPLWRAVVELLVAVLLFIGLASTGRYVLAYWNFRLTRHRGGTFHVARGLLTTRATSIDVSRLRGVGISQPLLLRLVGGARTIAIATGLETGRGASPGRGGTVLLPDAPLAEARRVAGVVIGRPDLIMRSLIDHGATARRRRFSRAVGGAALLVLAVGLAWSALDLDGLGWLAALVLLPLGALLAADRAHNLGHLIGDGFLVTQSGSLARRRATLETDAIIGWNLRQSFFQRRAGVVTLVATTAAGRQSYKLIDLSLAEARRVADEAVPGLLAEFSG